MSDRRELAQLDPYVLGQRLQEARTRRGLTQQEAADWLTVARTTITAIEKGERRIRPHELVKLAQFYGTQVSELVRQRPPAESFAVQFRTFLRREDQPDRELDEAAAEFQRLCEDYLALEELCGLKVGEAQTLVSLARTRQQPKEKLPLHYQRLAVAAFQQGKLSEGQLARYLRTSRVEAREIVQRLGSLEQHSLV